MMRMLTFALVWFCSLPAWAAEVPAAPAKQAPPPGWIGVTPSPYGPLLIQQGPPPPYRDYQMSRVLTPAERKAWREMAMPLMASMVQMDAREVMNHFAVKIKAVPGVSFDEVVESMKLRANQLNLKLVGSNLMWKEFQSVLGDTKAPRVEVFSFCDIAIGRDLLKVIPEMVVFLPCRIAVMEDGDKNIWVLMMDWDMTWLDLAGQQIGMTPELRQGVLEIRMKMEEVMRASANGEI